MCGDNPNLSHTIRVDVSFYHSQTTPPLNPLTLYMHKQTQCTGLYFFCTLDFSSLVLLPAVDQRPLPTTHTTIIIILPPHNSNNAMPSSSAARAAAAGGGPVAKALASMSQALEKRAKIGKLRLLPDPVCVCICMCIFMCIHTHVHAQV